MVTVFSCIVSVTFVQSQSSHCTYTDSGHGEQVKGKDLGEVSLGLLRPLDFTD
jgi:hypothetical protein